MSDYISNYTGLEIDDGIGKANTAYQKPTGGIPKTDLASAVQTSLGKADTAYQKPSGGIPATDLASDVIPTVPSAYASNPAMDGTASPGSSTSWAKGDHVHPSDTSRLNTADAATEFSTTSAYAVGDYTIYDGRLYRFTAVHTAGAWVGTDASAVNLGGELVNLKSAFDALGLSVVSGKLCVTYTT